MQAFPVARAEAAAVGHRGEKLPFPMGGERCVGADQVIGHGGVVAEHDVRVTIRTAPDCVRSVLLNPALERVQLLNDVVHVVAVGILELEEAGASTTGWSLPLCLRLLNGHGGARLRSRRGAFRGSAAAVEDASVEPQSLTVAHLVGQHLLGFKDAVVVRVDQDARRVVLLRDDEAPEAVEREDDVRIQLVGRDDPFNPEAGQRRKADPGGRRLASRRCAGDKDHNDERHESANRHISALRRVNSFNSSIGRYGCCRIVRLRRAKGGRATVGRLKGGLSDYRGR